VIVADDDGRPTVPSVVALDPNDPDGPLLVGRAAAAAAAARPASSAGSFKRLIGLSLSEVDAATLRGLAARIDGEGPEGTVRLSLLRSAISGSTSAAEDEPDAPPPTPPSPRLVDPEEASAAVVSALLDRVAVATGGVRPARAVVGVPAHFSKRRRDATLRAATRAGLAACRLIHEPVAAALAHSGALLVDDGDDDDGNGGRTILVLDLGGGTYDVALLEVGGGVAEVLACAGDPTLGGDDWDDRVAALLLEGAGVAVPRGVLPRLSGRGAGGGMYGDDGDEGGWSGDRLPQGHPLRDARFRAGLRAAAEAARVGLTTRDKVVAAVPVPGRPGPPIRVMLTRARVEAACADLYRRMRAPLDQCAWQAGIDLGSSLLEGEAIAGGGVRRDVRGAGRGPGGGEGLAGGMSGPLKREEQKRRSKKERGFRGGEGRRRAVSQVLLIGGATRMPAVARFVETMTGVAPLPWGNDAEGRKGAPDPDLAVALGACVQAGRLGGELEDVEVFEPWRAALLRALAAGAVVGDGNDDDDEGWDFEAE